MDIICSRAELRLFIHNVIQWDNTHTVIVERADDKINSAILRASLFMLFLSRQLWYNDSMLINLD